MKKSLTKLAFVASLFLAISCNESVAKKNPIFEKSLPDSKTYRDELVKLLNASDKSKLTYYFNEYKEKDGKEYLHITIEGEDFEAQTLMLIKKWDKTLEAIKEYKGKGYGGSEMVNLKFEVLQDTAKTEFVYVSADELID